MSRPKIPILTAEELEALRARSDQALGLPGRAYFSRHFYEAERRELFAAGWMGVGFASDLPNVGDAQAISIAGWELLLVRSHDGAVRCFHNICRHRGTKVVEGKCSSQELRCPYHGWSYDLDGSVLSAPSIAGERNGECSRIRKDDLALVPVSCGQWFDVIFVNIDDQALPMREHLRPAIARIQASFDLSEACPASCGSNGTFNYEANWKIVLEGAIEDYHLPAIHSAFAHGDDYVIEDGGNVYAGFSSRSGAQDAARRFEVESDGLQLPMTKRMFESGIVESTVLFIFPNTVLSCGPYWISTSLVKPTGPESAEYVTKTQFLGEAAHDRYAALREKDTAYWNEVFGEDEPIWESIQALSWQRDELGLATHFSPHWERGLHLFQLYVADKLTPKAAAVQPT